MGVGAKFAAVWGLIGLLAMIGGERPARAQLADTCGLEDPAVARYAPPVPTKSSLRFGDTPFLRRVRAKVPGSVRFGVVGRGAVGGALSGKTVYVSAGHGLTWVSSLGWRTQRGNTHDLVEDFISSETIAHYLIPYLRNMGAYVVPVRESGLNPNLVIVDDGGATAEGTVTTSADPTGYGDSVLPIVDETNPFTSGTSLVFDSATTETGRMVWTFDVPESGAYNVYVGYVQDASRASDAHYIVRHAGGEAHYHLDQRRHGSTWVLLGRFYFYAGQSAEFGSIVLANDSADAGSTLSADAVRIGGGVGRIDRGGGANGRPMFENNSRYAAQLNGAPTSVYNYSSSADGSDDVGTRSRFSAWDHEDGEDAVYIAWHTNAFDGTAHGTSSFAYGPSSFGPLSEFSGVSGSLELMDAVHNEMVGDFRAVWQDDWQDRGQHTAYFGEVNPNHNPEMPAVLFEIAFHDEANDADALRDPRFRRLAARAIAQGVAKYFAARDGAGLTLPPEPPVKVRAQQSVAGTVRLSWAPPVSDAAAGDAPTGYRVYRSRDGLAFDDGVDVSATDHELVIEERETVYVRITSTNAGGESLPSRVVGARHSPTGRAQVLVVAGFERLDGNMLIPNDLTAYALDTIERGFIDRINDGSYVARFGAAIDSAEVSFDSTSASAVAAGDIDLADYTAVLWFVGEESTVDQPFDADERSALRAYVAGGGKLLASGSEIAWALGERGDTETNAFLSEILHATFVGDDADTYAVAGVADTLDGVQASFDDFGAGSYDANFPDLLAPADGDTVSVMDYAAGTFGSAATLWRDPASDAAVMTMGFPFETIAGADARADVMARILASFEIVPDVYEEPEEPEDGGGCCDSGGGGGPVTSLLLLLIIMVSVRRSFTGGRLLGTLRSHE